MKKVHIAPKNKGFNDQRSLSEVPLVRVVSLGAVMAALLSSVSPVFASHFSSAGSTVQSVNAGVASAKAGRADHGRDRVANGDRSCGVDQIVSRSSSRLDKKISAEDKNQLSDGYGDYAFESSCGSDVSVNALTSAGTRSLINADVTAKDWFLEENNPVNWSVNTVPVNVTDTGVVSIDPRIPLLNGPVSHVPKEFVCATDAVLKPRGSVCLGPNNYVNPDDWWAVKEALIIGSFTKMEGSRADEFRYGYDPVMNRMAMEDKGAWKGSLVEVAIGDLSSGATRQITGVAAGRFDTDLINVAQLKEFQRWRWEDSMWTASVPANFSVNHVTTSLGVGIGRALHLVGEEGFNVSANPLQTEEGAEVGAEVYVNVKLDHIVKKGGQIGIRDTEITLANSVFNIGDKGIKNIKSVALSEDSTEAVTGAQLYGVKQNAKSLNEQIRSVGIKLTKLNTNISEYLGGGANVLLGKAPIYTIQGDELQGVHAAFDGVDSKLAELDGKVVFVQKRLAARLEDESLVVQDEETYDITIGKDVEGGEISIVNDKGKFRVLTGLKDGDVSRKSTEAVTGAQLYDVKQNAKSLNEQIRSVGIKLTKLNTNISEYLGGGADVLEGKAPIYIIQGEEHQGVHAAFLGVDSKLAELDGKVVFVQKRLAARLEDESLVVQDEETYDITIGKDVEGGEISIVNDKGKFRVLTGLKDGDVSRKSTEAVTGAQLYGVKQNAKSLNEQIRSVGIKLTKLNTNISEYLGGGADVLEGKAPIYIIQGEEHQGVHAAFLGVDSKLAELDGKVVFVQKRLAARLEDESLVVQDEETYDITIGKDVEGGEISIVNDEDEFRVLTGLKDGDVSKKSTEAVTGAQLYEVNQEIEPLRSDVDGFQRNVTKLNGNINKYLGGGANVLLGKAPIYIIQGEEHQGVHAAFLGVDSKLAELDGKVVFVQKRLAARLEDESLVVQDEETYDITIGKDVEGGEISIVNDEDEFRVLTGLKDGDVSRKSTEAVTGAQLYGVKQNAEILKDQIRRLSTDVTVLYRSVNGYLGGGVNVLEGKAPIYIIQGEEHQGVHAAFLGVDSKLTELDNKISNPGNIGDSRDVGDSSLVQQNEGSKLITIGGQVVGNEIKVTNKEGENRILTGLEDGDVSRKSTEAVTGAQLYGVKQNAKSLNEQIRSVGIKLTKLNTNISEYLGGGADVLEGKAPIYIIQGEEHQGVHAAFLGVDSKLTELDNKISNPGNVGDSRDVGDSSLVQQNEGSKLITIGGQVVGNEIKVTNKEGENRILSGLAAGKLSEDSTKAVTGAQLYGVKQNAEILKGRIDGVDGDVKKLDENINNYLGGGVDVEYLGGGVDVLEGKAPIYIIQGEEHQGVHTAFLGVDSKLTELDNKINDIVAGNGFIGQNSNTGLIVVGDKTKGIEINIANKDKETRILTGVADGDVSKDSTEAITGNQLYELNNQLAAYLGGGAGYQDGQWIDPTFTITDFGGQSKNGKQAYNNVADAFEAVNSSMSGLSNRIDHVEHQVGSQVNSDGLNWNAGKNAYDASHNGQVGKITNVKDGVIAAGSTDAITGNQLWAAYEKVNHLEDRFDAFTGGIVTYDKDEQGKKTNTITLVGGKEDEPVVIDNVAGGKIEESSKQAINGGQLHNYVQEQMSLVLADANKYTDEKIENIKNKENILTDIITQTNAYTDMKFNALSSEIEKAQKEARQAAAISLAVSNLRYSNTAGKFSIAFGSGVWRGQSALAFGTGYMSEDGKVRSNFSVTTSGGHWGVGAGLSLALK